MGAVRRVRQRAGIIRYVGRDAGCGARAQRARGAAVPRTAAAAALAWGVVSTDETARPKNQSAGCAGRWTKEGGGAEPRWTASWVSGRMSGMGYGLGRQRRTGRPNEMKCERERRWSWSWIWRRRNRRLFGRIQNDVGCAEAMDETGGAGTRPGDGWKAESRIRTKRAAGSRGPPPCKTLRRAGCRDDKKARCGPQTGAGGAHRPARHERVYWKYPTSPCERRTPRPSGALECSLE